jgi:hypothetical protein
MTINTQTAIVHSLCPERACGRQSCLILYKSDDCYLCDAAKEILTSVVGDFGLQESVISVVDIDSCENFDDEFSDLLALPAIRICGELILGLPDPDTARTRLMHAIMNECFVQ